MAWIPPPPTRSQLDARKGDTFPRHGAIEADADRLGDGNRDGDGHDPTSLEDP